MDDPKDFYQALGRVLSCCGEVIAQSGTIAQYGLRENYTILMQKCETLEDSIREFRRFEPPGGVHARNKPDPKA